MNIFCYIISLIIVLMAVPVGYFLAQITKEELKDGRTWFKYLILFAFFIIVMATIWNIPVEVKLAIILTAVAIIIITYISFKKSYTKSFKPRKRR